MAIYDKEKAKAGVEQVYAELKALAAQVSSASAADFNSLLDKYNNLPQTYDIDWAITEISAADAYALANQVRTKLVALGGDKVASGSVKALFNQ